ncbi:NAD(P)-binding protein [Cyathus striatus]|nr:NAD(P)-binding protein [Cyathus striatus]
MSPKVWLVTGSSSGLGLSVVKHALSEGDIVVATLRKPEVLSELTTQYGPSQLLVVKLDVAKPDEITSAFAVAIEKFGHIDVVYNNAGYSFLAEFESAPDDLARSMFEVNFWGAANVSREAIRVFRDVNKPSGGRLLQASSGAGVTGIPTYSYYGASKFALVGLSEAIAKEVDPSWNIKVVILDIGGFKTRALDPGFISVLPQHPQYANTTSFIRSYLTENNVQINFGDSDKAGREIHRIAYDDGAPLHVSLGLDSIENTKGKIELLKDNVEKSVVYCADLK